MLNARLFSSPLFLLRKKKNDMGSASIFPSYSAGLFGSDVGGWISQFHSIETCCLFFFSFSPPKDVDHTEAALIGCHSIGREKNESSEAEDGNPLCMHE